MDAVGGIVSILVMAALLGGVVFAAHRFVRRRMREGAWDEKGPIDRSLPPVDFLQVYPRPWGIHRPSIESVEDEENPFRYPVEREPPHDPHE